MSARASVLVALGLGLALGGCGDDAVAPGGSAPIGGGGESAGGSESGGTNAGGEGGAPSLHPAAGESCDVMAQNCAEAAAPKCVLDFTDTLNLPSTCGESLGDAAEGESCERPTDVAGIDTCAPGLFCSRLNQPLADPIQRKCLPLCDESSDCDAEQLCMRLNFSTAMEPFEADTRLIGNCVNSCLDVFEGVCPEKTRCLTGASIDGIQSYTCFSGSADKAVGETCASNNDCAAPLGCNLTTLVCAPFCDPTHPCPVNTGCSSTFNIGLCQPAPDAWTCDELLFADGVTCDCSCGAVDPDCLDPLLPAQGCGGSDVCKSGHCVPPAWTCPGGYYGLGDGCDCGCGAFDPDCADATVASCQYCGANGSCNTGTCPGIIDPVDNSTCQ